MSSLLAIVLLSWLIVDISFILIMVISIWFINNKKNSTFSRFINKHIITREENLFK